MTKSYVLSLVLSFMLSLYNFAIGGEVSYAAIFEGTFMDCDDFDNSDFLDCSQLTLDSQSASETCIQGTIDLRTAVENQNIELKVYKTSEFADELMFSVDGEICEHISDDSAPWYTFIKSMNISACPISIGTYTCKKMEVDISSVQDILTHQYCGEYVVIITVTADNVNKDVLSCYKVYVGIVEIKSD